MMRSLFSGVSGLKNHQTRMDVIGNNISNVNTHGFKKNRVNFQDLFYQNSQGATRPSDELGGINPKQVGLGMSIASIDTIHTQGAFETTGVSSDLAISGNGFFVLKDGENSFYTREGLFGVDGEGTLVSLSNGMKVQGWAAQELNGRSIINVSSTPGEMKIPLYGKMAPKATTKVDLACNLNKLLPPLPANATPDMVQERTWSIHKEIVDSFGNEHDLQINFTHQPDANGGNQSNTWLATVIVDPNQPQGTQTAVAIPQANNQNILAPGGANTFTLQFNDNGSIQQLTDGNGTNPAGSVDAQGNPVVGSNLSVSIAFDVLGSNPVNGAPARQTITLDAGDIGDFSDSVTQDSAEFSTKAVRQDGYKLGYMTNFEIDNRGVITGVYNNGVRKDIGQLAMATFTNPGGLEKTGDVNFQESTNSGEARIGAARTAGKGTINSGRLEMSNVDLAQEFVDMITTQRGFQANSRTIQTSDQMLQELLTLKR